MEDVDKIAIFFSSISIILIILKLLGVIAWSWFVITLPLWIPFVTVAILLILSNIFLKYFWMILTLIQRYFLFVENYISYDILFINQQIERIPNEHSTYCD